MSADERSIAKIDIRPDKFFETPLGAILSKGSHDSARGIWRLVIAKQAIMENNNEKALKKIDEAKEILQEVFDYIYDTIKKMEGY